MHTILLYIVLLRKVNLYAYTKETQHQAKILCISLSLTGQILMICSGMCKHYRVYPNYCLQYAQSLIFPGLAVNELVKQWLKVYYIWGLPRVATIQWHYDCTLKFLIRSISRMSLFLLFFLSQIRCLVYPYVVLDPIGENGYHTYLECMVPIAEWLITVRMVVVEVQLLFQNSGRVWWLCTKCY